MNHLALVIEDEVSLRTIYQVILSGAGYEVIEAHDGEEALAILAEVTPSVVFVDILLPRVDGTQILNYMRTAPHLQETKIVIVTAHNRFRQAQSVHPTDTFLLKPVRPQDLLEAVARATSV